MPITVDASVAAAWLLPDEASDAADRLYSRALQQGDVFQAPALWAWESGNLLHMAHKRGRLSLIQLAHAVRLLRRLDIRLETAPDEDTTLTTLEHARCHGLTFYDASYLEQALRTHADLATKDKALRRAALSVGVVCIEL